MVFRTRTVAQIQKNGKIQKSQPWGVRLLFSAALSRTSATSALDQRFVAEIAEVRRGPLRIAQRSIWSY
jgi:hypothetical protein